MIAATSPVRAAFDGAIDIVGDVHGEIEALDSLLDVLGYDERGAHRCDRRLIFIGDLCDRGPDSPAVIERVEAMVRDGNAQCLLGARFVERLQFADRPFRSRLGAVRWPEREIVFEDGSGAEIISPRAA